MIPEFSLITIWICKDEGKPKVVAVEGRTRRILKDIGNLVPDRAIEGKPGTQPAEKNKVTLVKSVNLFNKERFT